MTVLRNLLLASQLSHSNRGTNNSKPAEKMTFRKIDMSSKHAQTDRQTHAHVHDAIE